MTVTATAAAIPLQEKAELLARPSTYGPGVAQVEPLETHMSLLFVAGATVYKLKKPVVTAWFDFRSLAARERNCRDELRLNRRLAPDVYLGLSTITREGGGELALDGRGEVVDWLVRMRRLPRERMLDRRIAEATVTAGDADALADLLGHFYANAAPGRLTADEYVTQLASEDAVNRDALARFDDGAARGLLDRVRGFLEGEGDLLRSRVAAGRLVDGHGDLRPEHVCLNTPPVIIDCLEFSERLRQVDPFDEITYLGLECTRLGAPWIGPRLLARLSAALDDPVKPRLLRFYAGYRACVRARLALAHLDDPCPREPERWPHLAREYLRLGVELNPAPSVP
jgi:aminoglycoside phosphotransferase family enzyme